MDCSPAGSSVHGISQARILEWVGSIPGLGRSPGEGKGYSLQYSGLENSMVCTVHKGAESVTTETTLYAPTGSLEGAKPRVGPNGAGPSEGARWCCREQEDVWSSLWHVGSLVVAQGT